MRLDLVAKAAVNLGYDYFASALTLSPKKNAQLINELGMEVQSIYNVHYLPSDFKKNKGYERSITMCKEYDIFRQCYCGCVFAAMHQGIAFKEVNKSDTAFLMSCEYIVICKKDKNNVCWCYELIKYPKKPLEVPYF